MYQVTVKHVPVESMILFYTGRMNGQQEVARDLLARGAYETGPTLMVDGVGDDAAEEVFDLSNNPSRQGEREQRYGRGRSLSVGDIVQVDGQNILCASVGWIVL